MKTLVIAAFLCICTSAGAQNKKEENKNSPPVNQSSSYCMVKQGDALVLMKDGKQVYTDIKLADGTRITTNGRVLKADGTEKLLKENECADLDGELMKPVKLSK